MINLSFKPNEQKKDKDGMCPIFMTLTFSSQRIRKAVQHAKVKPSDWNDKKSRLKQSGDKSKEDNQIINSKLESLQELVHQINKVVLKENITLTKKYVLDRIENPSLLEVEKKSFFNVFEEFIKVGQSNKAKRTLMAYQTCFNFLKNFESEKKRKLTFRNIDFEFFEDFRTYAFIEKKIADNYFSKIIANLKSFLNWATERDYNTTLTYRKFKAPEIEKEVVYLTIEELLRLHNYDFKSNRLNHVKDTFCFACFTGLRFSDLTSLLPAHIHSDYILKNIQKTKEVNHKIPLNKYAKEILNRYKDTIHNPLPKISNQKYNSYIKECCKTAEIDSEIVVSRSVGGNRIETTKPKHEVISSHTARKTFATNSLILGMKEMVVRNITGHKKEVHFKKYIKIAEDVKKTEMDNTWDKI
ncbi:MAG: site-specific integrase [Reichenbachiella sp.]|uniref:site-specific integrase n=1 Tax=Reichenbachiella sp. TaxID=2184521 RepID=UPI002966AE94|nr:site-specific integrase [Reichenbachiella sp.]MDW3209296.1 site-specific integrase [Reichenbachiella sp.]